MYVYARICICVYTYVKEISFSVYVTIPGLGIHLFKIIDFYILETQKTTSLDYCIIALKCTRTPPPRVYGHQGTGLREGGG